MPEVNLKEHFEAAVNDHIHRSGIDKLMEWLDKTDFYMAPASTRFHGAKEEGLVLHSLNVHSRLMGLCRFYKPEYVTDESIAIVSLFHDLCKVGTYKTEMRWRKNEQNQWEQYPTWKHDEDFAYGGHGSKSVFLVQSFITLSPDEAAAINCHMGQHDATIYSDPSEVYERNKLAWLLHVADEAATYFDE